MTEDIPQDTVRFIGFESDLTLTSLYEAIDLMGIEITSGTHMFVVKVNKDSITFQHEVVTEFNRRFDNLIIRADEWPESDDCDEWFLTHVESRKTFYSTGA